MPDAEHHVRYSAVADFTNLAIEARKARAELKGLADDEVASNQRTADSAAQSSARKVKATEDEKRAISARNFAETKANQEREIRERDSKKAAERREKDLNDIITRAFRERAANEKRSRDAINSAEANAYRESDHRRRADSQNERDHIRDVTSAHTQAHKQREDMIKAELSETIRAAKEEADTEKARIREINSAHTQAHNQREAAIREEIKHYTEASRIQRLLEQHNLSASSKTTGSGGSRSTDREALRQAIIDGERFERVSTRATSRSKAGWGDLARSILQTGRNIRETVRDVDHGTSAFGKLRAAIRGAGSTSGGGGASNFISNLTRTLDRTAGSVTRFVGSLRPMTFVIGALITALGPLISALGALGGLAIGVASSLGSLAGAAGALPGLFAAAASGVGALVVAFAPFMGALKAYFGVQKQVGQAASDSGGQQRTSARQIRDATRQVADAERALAKAHENVEKAQLALNKARKEALKDLIDLREEVAKGSLNEEGAVLALAKAQDDYHKSLADPTLSLLDRQQALLDVKNAEWDLHDVQQTNIENADKLAESEKLGVEGSEKVVSAKQDVVDANENVQKSEEGLQNAIESLADAQIQATEGTKAMSHAQDALAAAMAKLSPSARAFLEGLIGMSDGFKAIRESVQEGFFGPLVGELDNIKGFLPTINTLLTDAAGALGRVAARGIEMVTSGPWKADFATLSKSNVVILENLGDAALIVADAFRHIAIAARPFTEWVSAAIKNLAISFRDWAKAGRESGSLTKFFDDLRERMQLVGRIIKNLLVTFLNFGKAATPFGDDMLRAFEKITKGWSEFSDKQNKDGSKFKKWLEDIKPILHEWAVLMKAIADGVVKIAIDPTNLKFASELLHDLATKTVPKLVESIDTIGKTPVFKSFLVSLNSFLDGVNAFFKGGGGGGLIQFFKIIGGALQFLANSGLAKVFGVISIGLGTLAAVSVVGKFLGIFKLAKMFAWILKNSKGIAGAFSSLLSGGGISGAKSALSGTGVGNANFNPQITQTNLHLEAIIAELRLIKIGSTAGAEAGAAGAASTATKTGAAAGSGLLARAGGFLRGAGAVGLVGLGVEATDSLTGGAVQKNVVDKSFLDTDKWKEEFALKKENFGETIGGLIAGIGSFFSGSDEAGKAAKGKIAAAGVGTGDDAGGSSFQDNVLTPIGHFFKGIFESITRGSKEGPKWFYDNVLTPIGHFFEWLGGKIAEAPEAIGDFVYDYILTPIGQFFTFLAESIGEGASNLGDLIYDYVLTPIGHFFTFLAESIVNSASNIGGLIYDYVLTPIGDFFVFIGDKIGEGVSSFGDFVYDYILTPIGHFFQFLYDGFNSIAGKIGDFIYKYVLTPIGHFFEGIGAAFKNAARWIIDHNTGSAAGVIKSTLGLRKGGKVPEGVSVVGETSPEFLVKRGSQLDVIPMSQSTFNQMDIKEAPGFNFGTDFGMSALREVQSSRIPAMAGVHNNTTNNNDQGINVEKIEINNPIPEKSGDSLFRGLQKARFFTGSEAKQL